MRLKSFLLFIGTFLLSHCNKDVTIKTNFSEIIEPRQNLHFHFAEKVKDLDKNPSLKDWHSSKEYLSITPNVPGSVRWSSATELVFSPADGFRPATKYTIQIKIPGYAKTLEVRTPDLRFVLAEPFYSRVNNKNVLAFKLSFNYKVSPKIAEKLQAVIDGKKYPLKAFPEQSAGTALQVYIDASERFKQYERIKIILSQGAKCVQCSEALKKDFTFFTYAPSHDFILKEARAVSEGGEKYLTLQFSESLDPNQDFTSLISLEIPFTTRLSASTLLIKAPFEYKKYKIVVSKKLRSISGLTLGETVEKEVMFSPGRPYLNFADAQGMYLRKEGAKNLALKITAIEKFNVQVHKIYTVNLVHFLREKVYRSYYDDGWEISEYGLENYGDLIYKATFTPKDLPKVGSNHLLKLDFFDTRKNFKGIFLLTVQDPERYWNRASKIIAISDIGIVVKETSDEFVVFCHSLKDNSPLSGVKVNCLSRSNVSFGEATTDGDGVAKIKKNEEFTPVMFLAEKGEDVNFLSLDFSLINNPEFATEGKNVADLDVFVYGERSLYRPGEEGHFAFALRDIHFKALSFPVKVQITSPRGVKVFEQIITPNADGLGEFAYKIPISANTGNYSVRLFKGEERIRSYTFKVEEFTPDRLKVQVKTGKKIVGVNKKINVKIKAENLYGTPAQFRKVNTLVEFLPQTFTNKKFKDYIFALHTSVKNFKTLEFSGNTDNKGEYSFSYSVPEEWNNTGMLRARILANVDDETGHSTLGARSTKIYTQTHFIGIQKIYPFQSVGKPIQIPFVVVNHEGQPSAKPFTIEIYRIKWESYWEKNSWGKWDYKTFKKEIQVSKQKVMPSGGKYVLNFLAPVSGSYEIRAFFSENSYVSYSLDCWAENNINEGAFASSQDGTIKISLPKEEYSPGETAEVLFTAPFSGKLLVTLECAGELLQYETINLKDKTAKWQFEISEKMLPNVFISATLFKEQNYKVPFSVARGLENLSVLPKNRKIAVSISAVKKSESKVKQTIHIKTRPNTYLTVSVVDEGVLQVAKEGKTDPYRYFYAPRKLNVKSYDLYSYLLPEYSEYAVGGGGIFAEEITAEDLLSPYTESKKSVSFWSGILRSDAQGNARFSINIPDFSGKLRIRVAAFQGVSFGYAEKFMTVADNVVITVGTPNFLAPKDKVKIPLVFANTTKQTQKISLQLKEIKGLKLYGTFPRQITLAPEEEKRFFATFLAGEYTEQARLKFGIGYGNKTKTITRKLTIRPASQLQVISQSGIIQGNGKITVNKQGNFLGTLQTKIVISANPIVRFAKAMDFLTEYPYGCLEQTISKTFPQLYASELYEILKNKKASNQEQKIVRENIRITLEKLSMFQTPSGGMSLWQGEYRPHLWATVFATHFLTEAKAKGYPVQTSMLRNNLRFLRQKVKQQRKEQYSLQGGKSAEFIPKWVPYALFVLAKNQEAPRSVLRFCEENYQDLTPEGKYLLSAAYKELGDESKAKKYLPPSWNHNWTITKNYFSSVFRDKALAAYALLIADPNNSQVPLILNELSEKLNRTKYFSTQEAVFSLLAVAQFNPREMATQIVVRTPKGKITLSKNQVKVFKNINEISVETDGKVYYYTSVKGIPANPSAFEGDNGLKVRRKYYSVNGTPLEKTFKQGETIIVKLTVENVSGEYISNGVVSDLIPGGFEIQNPRILETLSLKNFPEPSSFVYRDIREDRINIFATFPIARKKTFYYVIRATHSGEFILGPAMATDMYKPGLHSYSGSGKVIVRSKEIF